ncbi:Gfo/Idh/MocA family protein [Chitinophaga qingshengii]|uniref:Gfo/Idh/MocA family oxidoreductase n=1 Tax=Chitinophaga qingshengii TaxID=1569794 RepID=A0ABR7TS55_9BACT|nr:Gfo/Idh/MocA family oxidoreductase [Chitinophaga qingshengii]MBC9933308.1 Gfo/Idh/MocA family oxidoreductase [Chitinophaga qingshengii]
MDRINWGIIGCGNVTEVKSGPAFRLTAHSDVTAVMRRNRELAADYAQRHQVDRYYDDATDLLNDPHVNAIYIATPPDSHEAYALAAIEKGLPVYIEKPVGINLAAARRIAAAVSASGVRASVAHYRRRLPVFVRVKELLEEGYIGQVRHVDLRLWKTSPTENAGWRLDPTLSGGGFFHDLAPHQLDILLDYFGKPLKVSGIGTGEDPRVAGQVSGQVLFNNGILFNGSWNFIAPPHMNADYCTITGDAGTIRFHFFRDFHLLTVETATGTENFSFDTPAHVQAPLIAEVVQYFRGEGLNPVSVTDAVTGMEMMEQLLGL